MREREDVALTLGPTLSLSGLGQVRFSQLEGSGLELPQDLHTCAAQGLCTRYSVTFLNRCLGQLLQTVLKRGVWGSCFTLNSGLKGPVQGFCTQPPVSK